MDLLVRLNGLIIYTLVAALERLSPEGDILKRAPRITMMMSALFAYQVGLTGMSEDMRRMLIAKLKPQVFLLLFLVGGALYISAIRSVWKPGG